MSIFQALNVRCESLPEVPFHPRDTTRSPNASICASIGKLIFTRLLNIYPLLIKLAPC